MSGVTIEGVRPSAATDEAFGLAARGSRLVATMANGSPAFGQYKPAPGGGYEPWSLQVVEVSGDRIGGITFFLDTARFFPLFGLPLQLPD